MLKKKKCKYCGVLFSPRTTIQKNCYESDCIKKFYEENKAKISKVTTKRKQAKRKELKEKMLTISQLKQRARIPFQKWIRLRDKDKPCISCGKFDCADWAGGHYFSAERHSGLIFDERNVHKQCNTYCNVYKSGNLINYRIGLIERYGEEYVLKLESEADEKRDYKYTRQELNYIKDHYLKLVKNFEK